jgi:hypothetical protein
MNDEHARQDPLTNHDDEPTDAAGVMDPPREEPSDVMPDHRTAEIAETDVMAPAVEQPEND